MRGCILEGGPRRKARAGGGGSWAEHSPQCPRNRTESYFQLLLTLGGGNTKSMVTQKYKFETTNSTSVSDNIVFFPSLGKVQSCIVLRLDIGLGGWELGGSGGACLGGLRGPPRPTRMLHRGSPQSTWRQRLEFCFTKWRNKVSARHLGEERVSGAPGFGNSMSWGALRGCI